MTAGYRSRSTRRSPPRPSQGRQALVDVARMTSAGSFEDPEEILRKVNERCVKALAKMRSESRGVRRG